MDDIGLVSIGMNKCAETQGICEQFISTGDVVVVGGDGGDGGRLHTANTQQHSLLYVGFEHNIAVLEFVGRAFC